MKALTIFYSALISFTLCITSCNNNDDKASNDQQPDTGNNMNQHIYDSPQDTASIRDQSDIHATGVNDSRTTPSSNGSTGS